MKTTRTMAKPKISASPKEKKLSKAGKAMRAGVGKGMFIVSADCFADDDVQ